mmetsp:Transcript_51919/g.155837  ORF Transcript_51919/g.155837 Transcript_51919/m.155837 type:complete len:309 (-) Transcript_51919:1077-2003(-)
MAQEEQLDRLRAIGLSDKKAEQLPHLSSLPRASVLVPIFEKDSVLHTLLTKRSYTLSSHPGDVCFCGGRQDPEDGLDDVATALREAKEEVGLEPNLVTVLSRLRGLQSKNGLCVTPVIGWVDNLSLEDLCLSDDEVEAAFVVPLSYFVREENCSSKHDIKWAGEWFTMRTYFYSDQSEETFKIWGLTAAIAHEVARIASGELDLLQGYLFRLGVGGGISPRPVWRRYFYVQTKDVLHQYENQQQASRKARVATKKNRLPLSDCTVSEQADSYDSNRYEFILSALNGHLKWRLAAANAAERGKWMAALR